MLRKMICVASLMLLPLAGASARKAGSNEDFPRVVLGVDGIGQPRNLPVLVAERLGYFRAERLTVTLVDAPGEPSPAALVKDGRADGAVAFYHHTFMNQTNEHQVTTSVLLMGGTPQLKLMVTSRLQGKVKSPTDLKGLKIYTGGTNSGKTTSTNWLLEHNGLSARDYTSLAPTSPRAMAQALESGAADAIMAHEPDASYYKDSGAAFMLVDLESVEGTRQALGSLYPATALYVPSAYIAEHPDIVRRLVDACLKAMAYIKTHDAATIADQLPPKVVGKDRPAFVRLLAQDKRAFEIDGPMPADAARMEWQVMTSLTPKYGAIDFDDTFTNRFVAH
ncbi:MAG: ABC transporter substrate-binding protein [Rhodanobacter sp.]